MKTCSFPRRLALALGVLLLADLPLASVSAAPARYTVDWRVGSFDGDDPLGLAGSDMTLEMSIDTAGLVPDFNGPGANAELATLWPNATTLVSLAIHGSSGGGDGDYAIPRSAVERFAFMDNFRPGPSARDVTQFPGFAFSVSGIDLDVAGLIAFFDPAFDNPVGIVQPYPFLASEVVRWQTPTLEYQNSSDDS